ncbi:MAG TPA: hypothetical protein VFN40_06540 [Gemmatimonadales bacterium]|nr:hypothetical protein [Gemmatimonadales bacterium]
MPRHSVVTFVLALLLATPLAAQKVPALPVPTQGLAGQQVALVPLTLIATDPAFQADTLFDAYRDRRATLTWADSLIGDAFVGRAPEVKWVLPPALRKIARRAPGIVDDPDQMGQALLRAPRIKDVPDPLRASLRNLMAVVGGRVVMVPAALGFSPDTTGRVRAELSLVAADTRSGKVVWRSLALGVGPTPAAALAAALDGILPLE